MINPKLDKYENLSGKTSIGTELLFAALVFSLIIIYIFVAPQYKQTKIVKERIILNQESIKMKEVALEKIKNHNKTNQELEEKDLEKFKNLLKEKNDFEDYLANIDKIANINESRMSLGEFTIGKPAPALFSKEENINGLQMVKINFTAKGRFDNFMSFLDSLEKNIPLIELNSLSLRNIIEKGEAGKNGEIGIKTEEVIEENILVESDIEMSYYYLGEKLQAE